MRLLFYIDGKDLTAVSTLCLASRRLTVVLICVICFLSDEQTPGSIQAQEDRVLHQDLPDKARPREHRDGRDSGRDRGEPPRVTRCCGSGCLHASAH